MKVLREGNLIVTKNIKIMTIKKHECDKIKMIMTSPCKITRSFSPSIRRSFFIDWDKKCKIEDLKTTGAAQAQDIY